jgi:hypothetical protein
MERDGDITMTTDMVRKQIYIYRRQQNLLRQLARQRGMSEAEIIRRAIDRETALGEIPLSENSHTALEEIIQAAYISRDQSESDSEPYRFNRADLYEERENRWIRDRKKD